MRESRRNGMAALFGCSTDTVGVLPAGHRQRHDEELVVDVREHAVAVGRHLQLAAPAAACALGPPPGCWKPGDDEVRLAVGAVPAHRHEAVLVVVHPHARRVGAEVRAAGVRERGDRASRAPPPAGIHTRSVMIELRVDLVVHDRALLARRARRDDARPVGRVRDVVVERRLPASASRACPPAAGMRQMSPPSSVQLTRTRCTCRRATRRASARLRRPSSGASAFPTGGP